MTNETLLTAALEYACRGWAVFPCHSPADDGRCTCRRVDCASPGKHPRTRHGLHDASTDPAVILTWWHRWAGANIGVRTGAVSGLVVLDVDPGHDGIRTLDELRRSHGPLPDTRAVRTGGVGHHYWFAHPSASIPNSAGRIGPGLDIRGDGGYVIAPPSRHLCGGRYGWTFTGPLAPLPEWLAQLCRPPATRSTEPHEEAWHRAGSATSWARAALEGELRKVRTAPEGARNVTLNRAAFALGQLVGGGHLSEDVARDALVCAGEHSGLGTREARATVASGLRAGSRSPRSPSRSSAVPVHLGTEFGHTMS